ncbi:MAG TPA: BatA domain-containing protein [Acidobacteriota bacterium]|nr:BatA domain-containing protein [Acidobacteriota bacterium]
MQFLNPWFLLGAAAVAVPIFLHLFQKQRKTSFSFASLMFVRRLPVKETRRRQLRYLLLLALRCLGIVLLALAFARPVLTSAWLSRDNPLASRSVVVLIDRSMSVSQTEVWQQALQAARDKIESLGEGEEGMLMQFGGAVEVLTTWESSPQPLLEALDSLVKPSYESTSFSESLRLAAEQLRDAGNGRKQIYLITDLQRQGLAGDTSFKAPPEITVEIENVGAETYNLYIEQTRLDRFVFGDRYPSPILVRVSTSPPRAAQGSLKLFLEGQLVESQDFATDEGGGALVTLDPFEVEDGVTRGRIVAEADDGLAADNTHYFVVERRQPRTILLVNGPGRAGFFLRQALQAGDNLAYQVRSQQSLGNLQLDPTTTPLLILNNLPTPPEADRIEAFLQAGGGVIVTLGNDVRPEAYNREWGHLLPVRIGERTFVKGGGRSFTAMTEINWRHPVFTIFQDVYQGALSSTQFFGYWEMQPIEDAVVFARFSEGSAALAELPPEHPGRLIVMASNPDAVWSDFPLRSAFVPFWQAAAHYATRWSNRPASALVDQSLGLSESGEDLEAAAGNLEVLDPSGRRVLGLDAQRPDFIRLTQPGHYEIRRNKTTNWMAVNPPPFESDLSAVEESDFLAVFVPARSRAQEDQPVQEQVQDREEQQSLWWLFILLATGVFALEALIANRTVVKRTVTA